MHSYYSLSTTKKLRSISGNITLAGNAGKKQVPGDEAGSWQVTEGVNHGDHQRDDHNAGVYDVQLGAEVNFEPKKMVS